MRTSGVRGAGRCLAVLAATLIPAAAGARPEEPPTGAAPVASSPQTPSPSPSPSPRARLRLGPFGTPGSRPTADSPPPVLRFDTQIDVEAKATRDLNEAMAVWWRHFNIQSSIYGRGINMRTSSHPGAVDIVPAIEWIARKIADAKKEKENRKKAPPLPAEKPPGE